MRDPIRNPILKGFYPDPTICCAGEDFYLATSSFSFFPGVPVFHSRDLVHWHQIGHVFTDKEILRLDADVLSNGLFAPTLRYHNGTFYCIVQNASEGRGCFDDTALLATATDPAGPWEYRWIHGAGGDPSLFFDEDGKLYTTFSYLTVGQRDVADHGIYLQELDRKTYTPIGAKAFLWDGAMKRSPYPEASHIFKRNGWYYLIIAEDGTEHYHAVTIARSRTIDGIYESCPHNPIMTHRHLANLHPICNVGHADYIETPDGEGYMVMLGSRICGGYHKNLGRETYLVPVIWEDDWPKVSPETGKVEFEYPAPNLPQTAWPEVPERDDFDGETLALQWNFAGSPVTDFYRLSESKLCLKTIAAKIHPDKPPFGGPPFGDDIPPLIPKCISFVGRRQQDYDFTVTAKMEYMPKGQDFAGICIMQDTYTQLRLDVVQLANGLYARVVKNVVAGGRMPFDSDYEETVLGCCPLIGDTHYIRITSRQQEYTLEIGSDMSDLVTVADQVDGRFLGIQSFIGSYIGMFATGNGKEIENEACFDWFIYQSEA